MPNVELWAINHVKSNPDPLPNYGGIHYQFTVGQDDGGALDPRYCDMAAPYTIWTHHPIAPVVGFHGYRKMINFRDHPAKVATRMRDKPSLAMGWEEVGIDAFNAYKDWLREWSGASLEHLLQDYDLLTVEPFNCAYNANVFKDYCVSRSPADALRLETSLRVRGLSMEKTALIRPMHFVARDYVFSRFMRFWNEIRLEIEPDILSQDSVNPNYSSRALAMLSERIWSLWTYHSNLRVKTFPLLICWDAK